MIGATTLVAVPMRGRRSACAVMLGRGLGLPRSRLATGHWRFGEDVDKLLTKPCQRGFIVGARVPGNHITQAGDVEREWDNPNPGHARVNLSRTAWQGRDQIRTSNRQYGGTKVGHAQADAPPCQVFGEHRVNNGAPRIKER